MAAPTVIVRGKAVIEGVAGSFDAILYALQQTGKADQAFNEFSAFPEDAMVRIAPDEIKKTGKVPKNGSIFFTIFQTFMYWKLSLKITRSYCLSVSTSSYFDS